MVITEKTTIKELTPSGMRFIGSSAELNDIDCENWTIRLKFAREKVNSKKAKEDVGFTTDELRVIALIAKANIEGNKTNAIRKVCMSIIEKSNSKIIRSHNKLFKTNYPVDGQEYSEPIHQIKDEWISVDERLPEVGFAKYLVAFVNNQGQIMQCIASLEAITRHIGQNSPVDLRWYVFPSRGMNVNPTHWQPIPTNPK